MSRKIAAPGEILELFKGGYLSIAETIDALEEIWRDPPPPPRSQAGKGEPFGYVIEKSGVGNGYYFITPADFRHVEERFHHLYKPLYTQPSPASSPPKNVTDLALETARNRIAELVNERDALRDALEPFAEVYNGGEGFEGYHGGEQAYLTCGRVKHYGLTLENFRAAAVALFSREESRPLCRLCGLEDGACICAAFPSTEQRGASK